MSLNKNHQIKYIKIYNFIPFGIIFSSYWYLCMFFYSNIVYVYFECMFLCFDKFYSLINGINFTIKIILVGVETKSTSRNKQLNYGNRLISIVHKIWSFCIIFNEENINMLEIKKKEIKKRKKTDLLVCPKPVSFSLDVKI